MAVEKKTNTKKKHTVKRSHFDPEYFQCGKAYRIYINNADTHTPDTQIPVKTGDNDEVFDAILVEYMAEGLQLKFRYYTTKSNMYDNPLFMVVITVEQYEANDVDIVRLLAPGEDLNEQK